jgi:hypothetical protein
VRDADTVQATKKQAYQRVGQPVSETARGENLSLFVLLMLNPKY